MNNDLYIQYGCGLSAPMEWRNFDASPTLRFERLPVIGQFYTKNDKRFPTNVEYGDIVKGLPVEINSCKGVYCSHILEHLSLNDFRMALKNTHRILQPGGVFRLVLPDLEYYINQYHNNNSTDAAFLFMQETYLGYEHRPRRLKAIISSWFGNSHHLWMWDYKSISQELLNAGFVNVQRANYNSSEDPYFKSVEEESRWEDCLGVECKK